MQMITLDFTYFTHLDELSFIYVGVSFQWVLDSMVSGTSICLNPFVRNQEAIELNVGHCYIGPKDTMTTFAHGDVCCCYCFYFKPDLVRWQAKY